MLEAALVVGVWAALCAFIVLSPPKRIHLAWIIAVLLILASPVIAWFYPGAR